MFEFAQPYMKVPAQICAQELLGVSRRSHGRSCGTWIQVLNWASHLLLWTKGAPASHCHCEVPTEMATCSGIVKHLLHTCLESSAVTSGTATTTTVTDYSYNPFWWWWLVLIALAFGLGVLVDRSAGTLRCLLKLSHCLDRLQPISPTSTDSSASWPRRGIAA